MTLCELLSAALQDTHQYSEQQANEAAVKIIEWGATRGHSGGEYYWPARAILLSREERDAQIVKMFNGSNIKEVCKRFGVSHQTVYNAIHRHRN